MSTINEIMTANHNQCEQLFSKAKAFIIRDDWEQARSVFDIFRNVMKRHLSMEDDVLFPSLEQRTGQTMGPTKVLRMEHEQMRQLLSDLEEAVSREDRDQYLGFAKSLMVAIQEHSKKEEEILYPMSDQTFGSETAEIIQRMESI